MTTQDEHLLGALARRNWLILLLLTALSALWRSWPITAGVVAGGLTAIVGYHWLFRSLKQVLTTPSRQSASAFRVSYFIRLGALTMALFLLITFGRVEPVGLVFGLSVVIINIAWTTLTRTIQTRRHKSS